MPNVRRPNLSPTNNANSTKTRTLKGFKPLDIDEINQFKHPKTKYIAVRFDASFITQISNERRVVCKCECGNYFTTLQKSILTGNRISCGCLRFANRGDRGRTIAEINEVLPENSKLTAISFAGVYKNTRHKTANFKCSCGVTKELPIYMVVNGNTKSCGCYLADNKNRPRKYSVTIKKLRNCYTDMMQRCYNPKCGNYRFYGAKGVTVCDEWRNSYQAFLDWCLANGWKPGLQLDKDIIAKSLGLPNNLYAPDRCQFVTLRENLKHAKMGTFFTVNGEELNKTQICKKYKVAPSTFDKKRKTTTLTIQQIIEKYGKK